MRVVISVMDHPEAFKAVRPVLSLLRRAGFDVTVLAYSCLNVFPLEELKDLNVGYFTICDGGVPALPRISRGTYRKLCGDDFDFVASHIHQYIVSDYPLSREFLSLESPYYQRYYSAAYRVEQILTHVNPDFVIVQQGSEPVSKIILSKSGKLGIPVLLWETPFFPGKILVDSRGMHFFKGRSLIDENWARLDAEPISSEDSGRVIEFLNGWKEKKESKYPQPDNQRELERIKELLHPGHKVAFMPGQIPWDANVLTGLKDFTDYFEFVEWVRENVPDGWVVIKKVHPKLERRGMFSHLNSDKFIVTEDTSIHDLIALSDVVLVHSSNVGMESLIYKKPVVCFGDPYYSGKGFTLDVGKGDRLEEVLASACEFMVDEERLAKFLSYVIYDYLIDENDADSLSVRLRSAEKRDPNQEELHAPFCEGYSHKASDYVEFVKKVNRYLRKNYSLNESFEKAEGETAEKRGLNEPPLFESGIDDFYMNGERETSILLSGIKRDRLVRYFFACELLKTPGIVLDIACGSGYGSYIMAAAKGVHVVAVDSSPWAIEFAKDYWKHRNIVYKVSSVGSFPEIDAKYDCIVSHDTLVRIQNDSLFIRNYWNLVKEGGIFIVSAPHHYYNSVASNEYSVKHYAPDEIKSLFEVMGDLGELMILGQDENGDISEDFENKYIIAIAMKRGERGVAGVKERIELLLNGFNEKIDEKIREFDDENRLAFPLVLKPYIFRSNYGCTMNGRVVAEIKGREGVFVYGPYIPFEKGRYTANFLLSVEGEASKDLGALILDVSEGDRSFARGVVKVDGIRGFLGKGIVEIPVSFRLDVPASMCEFRVFIQGVPFYGSLGFHGVVLNKLM